MRTHKATFYAQVKANRRYGPRNADTGLRAVSQVRLTKTTQSYPQSREANTVVLKLTIEVPDTAFDPLLPNFITVPESMIQHPIVIEALDANDSEVSA